MNEPQSKQGSSYLLLLSLGALGVVFGDIGTSPLYAFREVFVAAVGLPVTRDSIFGVLSLMCWSLIVVVSVKYLLFVMRADNHGEGGILAMTALIVPPGQNGTRGLRWGLVLLGLFGTALLYGDGMITPAISVLSAVEGLEIVAPSLERLVVPIAVAILVALFSIQRRGTATVGSIFGPVMIVWFAVLAVLGFTEIVHHPSILAAVNPGYAVGFVADQPRLAFLALGAIFLVVTGSEALYADMGHFGRRPILLGWFTLVFPALLINYFGQGALLIENPEAVENPFYLMAPDGLVLPLVVLATLATIIASQALITGAYSLTMQAIQLGYLPRLDIDHTSPREIGQIYIPSVNYALMFACVGLVITFESSTRLAAAYGMAVTATMVITTILLFVVMMERWNWSLPVAGGVTAIFLVIDVAFLSANVVKIPAGGWFPLVVGGAIFLAMTTWKRGRQLVASKLRRGELEIEEFIRSVTEHPQRRVPGTAVYLFPDPGATPPALLTNLRHNEVLHTTNILVAVQTTGGPRVAPAGRATVHDLGGDFRQVVLRFGFMDQPDVPGALETITTRNFGFDGSDAVYFLGKETVIATDARGMALWRDRLFALMHRNAVSAAHHFSLPPDQTFEVGVHVEI